MKPSRWWSARRSASGTAGPGVLRHRIRMAAPLILQCSLMAGVAWWISQSLFGHGTPIFAATAALICLSSSMGGRGRQAVDLFVGVVAGVMVGEGVRALHTGNAFWLIVPAIALAMSVAALVNPRPLTYIQAGASVLIVVAVGASSSPVEYLVDAAVGGLVGLLGSQVLFTPDPVKLVEEPVRKILRDTADALRTAGEALGRGSVAQAGVACERARDAHARLGELSGARAAAQRVTGRTVRGRRRLGRLRRADRPLDDVDVLIAAFLLLCDDVEIRLALAASPASDQLPARLTELADGVTELAARPVPVTAAAPDRRRRAADRTPPARPSSPCAEEVAATDVYLHDARAALRRLGPPAADPTP